MREFSKFSPELWCGDLAESLRGDHLAQALACYLITCPHANAAGLYRLPLAYAAADLGAPIEAPSKPLRSPFEAPSEAPSEGVRGAFEKLVSAGFCEYDERHAVVWVRKHARHQFPEPLKPRDNNITYLVRTLSGLSKSSLLSAFLAEHGEHLGLTGRLEPEAPSKALAKPLRSPFEAPSKHGDGDGDRERDGDREGEGECRGGAAPTLWPEEAAEQDGRRSAPVAPVGASLPSGGSKAKATKPKPPPVRLPAEIEDEPIPASVRVPESFGACATLGDLWRARIKQAKRVGRKFTDSAMEKQARQVVQLVAKEGAVKAARVLVLLGERGWQGIDLELCDRELAKEDGRRPVNGFGGGFDRDAAHRRLATAGMSAKQWAMIEALDAKLAEPVTQDEGG